MKNLITPLFLILFNVQSFSQSNEYTFLDSLPITVILGEAIVLPKPIIPVNHKTQYGSKRYTSLERKVLKVWPYASYAGTIMNSLEETLSNVTCDKERNQIIEDYEQRLKSQFEDDLRKMTFSEGVILIKLIDRQTDNSSYVLIQQLKGRINAFMWQGVARIFGHNLKSEYQPLDDDAPIEHIIYMNDLDV